MSQQRERGARRKRAQRTSASASIQTPLMPEASTLDAVTAGPSPLDQQPTVRYGAARDAASDVMTTYALPALDVPLDNPLDDPLTLPPQTTRTLASASTASSGVRRPTAGPSDVSGVNGGVMQQTQALVPLKPDAERKRALAAINKASGGASTLIPGARRYRPPGVVMPPRRRGPRSAVTQFVVSMIVTAMLISALTLSTPLGQAAALNVNGPVRAYANAAPWIPTPTPTPKPTATPRPIYRPPAGSNPGQQAVINEIVAVFGGYSQGALAIAKCESGYDPNAWNAYPILNSHASGVFQILFPSTWDTTSYAGSSPFNADANIRAAYQIFQRDGYSWREWQCQP